jgi:hypothetical protein
MQSVDNQLLLAIMMSTVQHDTMMFVFVIAACFCCCCNVFLDINFAEASWDEQR